MLIKSTNDQNIFLIHLDSVIQVKTTYHVQFIPKVEMTYENFMSSSGELEMIIISHDDHDKIILIIDFGRQNFSFLLIPSSSSSQFLCINYKSNSILICY